jgi:arylsulfatase A
MSTINIKKSLGINSVRKFLYLFSLTFILVSVSTFTMGANPLTEKPPNIVILYADDMGYGDLGVQNPESKIPTPNLDKLASEGIRFTDGHSSAGVCSPSRYALLTGRYHWRKFHGIAAGFGKPLIENDRLTLPEILKEKGYTTACIGKWHLGWNWNIIKQPSKFKDKNKKKPVYQPADFDWQKAISGGPLSHGFDYYFGDDVPNFPPYAWIENDRLITKPTEFFDQPIESLEGSVARRPGPKAVDWKSADVMPRLTEKAVAWIRDQKNSDKPFFLYFPWTSPHLPVIPADEFLGKSNAGPYGDYVYQSDWTAGQVLKALEESGLAENTIVIFTSDNGPEKIAYERIKNFDHKSMAELRGLKRDTWEGGHRVPFTIKWPGVIEKGRVSNETINQVDIMATIASIIGYKLPNDAAEDSYDLLPLLKGDPAAQNIREATVQNTRSKNYAIRKGNWVLIYPGTGMISKVPDWYNDAFGYKANEDEGGLYNLENDVSQKDNLYAKYPQKVTELKALLEKYKSEGRSIPLRN